MPLPVCCLTVNAAVVNSPFACTLDGLEILTKIVAILAHLFGRGHTHLACSLSIGHDCFPFSLFDFSTAQ